MMRYLPFYYALEQLTAEMVTTIKRTLNEHAFEDFTFEKAVRLYNRTDAPCIESICLDENVVMALVVTDDMINDTRHEYRTKLEGFPAETVFSVLRILILDIERGK